MATPDADADDERELYGADATSDRVLEALSQLADLWRMLARLAPYYQALQQQDPQTWALEQARCYITEINGVTVTLNARDLGITDSAAEVATVISQAAAHLLRCGADLPTLLGEALLELMPPLNGNPPLFQVNSHGDPNQPGAAPAAPL